MTQAACVIFAVASAHERTRHDRPHPRLLGDAPQLGALDRRTTRPAATASSRPAYPGFEVEVEALNADPSPIEALTVPAIVEHLESVVGALETPPILIGHSAGGVFTQILLDHGFGAAGVAINSAPTEGVKVVPLSQIRSTLPGAEEPRQPPPGRRLHPRAVALRVHQHVQRGGVPRALRALPHPGLRLDLLGQRAGQRPARPPGRPGSTTRTTTARRCCSSPAARTT